MNQSSYRPVPTLRQRIRRLLLVCFAVYLLIGIGCTGLQRRMIYHPSRVGTTALDRLAQPRGLERWRNFAGQNIGWKRLSRIQPAEGQVLITHGNAGCAIDRSDYANFIQQAAAMDVFILEYPGYGDRAGSPSETALREAAEKAFRVLPTEQPTHLVGESLGTGVAAWLAGGHPREVAGVLLVAPYNSLTDVAQHHMPILPVHWLLRDRFPAEEFLRDYRGPVAMLVAGKDRVVPAKFGRRLFDRYAGPKRLWILPQATHETIHDQTPKFWREVVGFWQSNLPSSDRQ